MKVSRFAKNSAITLIARVMSLLLGMGTSVVIARLLGPEGRGIYALAYLLPAMIVTFVNLGIGPATVYYVAKRRHPLQGILGHNIMLSLGIGTAGILAGLILILYFSSMIFPGVSQIYLLIALPLIPLELCFTYLQCILQGKQHYKEYNIVGVLNSGFTLAFILLALWAFHGGVAEILIAIILALLVTNLIVFSLTRNIAGGVSLRLNRTYLAQLTKFGIQAHVTNVLGFLNYRVDMFLVNGFLNPVATGFYSVSVGVVEKLWLVSQASSIVLFQKVASESDERARSSFTPLVARSTLLITSLAAFVIYALSGPLIELLYTSDFNSSVKPLQALLPGVVALSVWRLLASDLAGRGRPLLNAYIAGVSVIVNVVLNVIWIPVYGIEGASWASTVSYGLTLIIILIIYCRLSGNPWTKVLLPQRGDWALYWKTGIALGQWAKGRLRVLLGVGS